MESIRVKYCKADRADRADRKPVLPALSALSAYFISYSCGATDPSRFVTK